MTTTAPRDTTTRRCSAPGATRRTSRWRWKRCGKRCVSCRALFIGPKGWSTPPTRHSGGRCCRWSAGAWTFRCKRSGASAHRARRSSPSARPAASTRVCWRRHSPPAFRPRTGRRRNRMDGGTARDDRCDAPLHFCRRKAHANHCPRRARRRIRERHSPVLDHMREQKMPAFAALPRSFGKVLECALSKDGAGQGNDFARASY